MSRESVIAIAAVPLVGCLVLLLYAGGAFESREPDISGAIEWLSAEKSQVRPGRRSEIVATRPASTRQCLEALKSFTEEYPDLEAVWVKRPELQSVAFPGAGDDGATIRVECSRAAQTLTISQHWE
jgi:hypothetical protein